jgi:hypothetical protein
MFPGLGYIVAGATLVVLAYFWLLYVYLWKEGGPPC